MKRHKFLQNNIKSLAASIEWLELQVKCGYFHIEPDGLKTVPKSFLNCHMPLQLPPSPSLPPRSRQGPSRARDQSCVGWGLSPKLQRRVVLSHVLVGPKGV